jgi:hypothetical protein
VTADDWIQALRVAVLVVFGIGIARVVYWLFEVFTYFFFGS